MPVESLKEHAVPVIMVLAFLVMAGFGTAWRIFWSLLKSIETKVAELCKVINTQLVNCPEERRKCRDSINAKIDDMMEKRDAERKAERDELWEALNHHSHGDNGKVQR